MCITLRTLQAITVKTHLHNPIYYRRTIQTCSPHVLCVTSTFSTMTDFHFKFCWADLSVGDTVRETKITSGLKWTVSVGRAVGETRMMVCFEHQYFHQALAWNRINWAISGNIEGESESQFFSQGVADISHGYTAHDYVEFCPRVPSDKTITVDVTLKVEK
ncbi:hypothetical protein L596_024526 [Steinernema carpocapsae]|uniref:Uncharacterized protein n=1 Tax=Steinernema carpocapsae TaxID=34508 RepID=A0A4U5MHB1_STECR|nr:hypothetical protein L596_024526 [Steinernema carpocapsae]